MSLAAQRCRRRYFKKPFVEDFPAISAVLRLATKYFIDPLRERCLHRLELDWPATLLGWQAREAEATEADGRYNPRMSCPHPIIVIAFAREMGLDSLLPSAFYDLCRYGPSKIVAGASMSAGSRPTVTGVTTISSPVVKVYLSADDLHRVFLGRECAGEFVYGLLDSCLCLFTRRVSYIIIILP